MNQSIYVFVELGDVTNAMLNRSINKNMNQAPRYKTSSPWWSFASDVEFLILEIPYENLSITNVFDGYVWHTEEEAHAKIDELIGVL